MARLHLRALGQPDWQLLAEAESAFNHCDAMTKKEIVKTISDELGLTQQQVKQVVERFFTALIDTLADDGRIELRNFGVFEVKVRAARNARNPKTGEPMPIPERSAVTFKPGKEMEEQVQLADARRARLARLANPPLAEESKKPAAAPESPPPPPASPPAN